MDLCPKRLGLLLPLAVLLGVVGGYNSQNASTPLKFTQNLNYGGFKFSFPTDTPDKTKFEHSVALNEIGNVRIAWDFTNENITFKLSAPTYGWIGMGIARSRLENAGADFAVMGFRNALKYIADLHIDSRGRYVADETWDVEAEYVWETEGKTFAIFNRPLITCDHEGDVDITPDTLRIIWAYGSSDIQDSTIHPDELLNVKNGSINIKLLNPSVPPLQMDRSSHSDIKTLLITAQNISVEHEGYANCIAFRFQNISAKAHIIQFEPIIDPGNGYSIRQIVIRQCIGSKHGLSSAQQTECNCDEADFAANCTVIAKWATQMSTFTFPEDTGFPIGGTNIYFTMDTYYNPKISGLIDSSGMKIYYTSQPRKHEVGVLTTGSLVHESQIIPPRSREFLLQGHCMKKCIELALPQEGQVTIFASLMHAREKGRKIKVRHFRNGEELIPVSEDKRFDFLYQETEFLNRYIQLKSGDNMIVECTYDTFDRNEITLVNNSKGGESCLAYLSYYPRIAKFTECKTAPIEEVIMKTVGAKRPKEMKKLAEEFEWTRQQTRQYNDQLLTTPVYVQCEGDKSKELVPQIKKPYNDKRKCKMPEPSEPSETTRSNEKEADDRNGATPLTFSGANITYLTLALCAYHNLASK